MSTLVSVQAWPGLRFIYEELMRTWPNCRASLCNLHNYLFMVNVPGLFEALFNLDPAVTMNALRSGRCPCSVNHQFIKEGVARGNKRVARFQKMRKKSALTGSAFIFTTNFCSMTRIVCG